MSIPGRPVPASLPALVLHARLDAGQAEAGGVWALPPVSPLAQIGLRAAVLGLLPGAVEGAQAVRVLVVVQFKALRGQREELLFGAVVLQGRGLALKHDFMTSSHEKAL